MHSEIVRMPLCIGRKNGQLQVIFLKTGRKYYKEPFFLDSLLIYHGISIVKDSTLDKSNLVRPLDFSQCEAELERIPVDEFLREFKNPIAEEKLVLTFHVGRCGSTLITQMLSESDRFFVLSEHPIINNILDPNFKESREKVSLLLKAAINSIVGCAPGSFKLCVFKLRSWNVLFLPKIIRELGACRWLFVHRNAGEVLASVKQSPPGWLRARTGYLDFFAQRLIIDREKVREINEAEFITRLFGEFCRIAKENQSPQSFFLDYKSLPVTLFEFLNLRLGIEVEENEKRAMMRLTEIYAKDVSKKKKFEEDWAVKVASLTEAELALTSRFAESERTKLISY
jgi:hypothetical protein